MQNPAKLALGVVGGYLLGRSKKGRLALLAVGYFAGKQMGKQQSGGGSGVSELLSSPQAQAVIQQLSGPLLEAGKTAATAAATKGVSALSSNLSERTERLKGYTSGSQESSEEPTQNNDEDAAQSSDETESGSQDSASATAKESGSK